MKPARVTARKPWSVFGRTEEKALGAVVLTDADADARDQAIADAVHAGLQVGLQVGPHVEPVQDTIRIGLDGQTLARSSDAVRVVWGGGEVGHDTTTEAGRGDASYFLPARDVEMNRLHPSDREGWSDQGGRIAYFHLIGPNGLVRDAVWFHPEPRPGLEAIRLHLAFFARSVDEVWVGRKRLAPGADTPQGGWALPLDAVPIRPV